MNILGFEFGKKKIVNTVAATVETFEEFEKFNSEHVTLVRDKILPYAKEMEAIISDKAGKKRRFLKNNEIEVLLNFSNTLEETKKNYVNFEKLVDQFIIDNYNNVHQQFVADAHGRGLDKNIDTFNKLVKHNGADHHNLNVEPYLRPLLKSDSTFKFVEELITDLNAIVPLSDSIVSSLRHNYSDTEHSYDADTGKTWHGRNGDYGDEALNSAITKLKSYLALLTSFDKSIKMTDKALLQTVIKNKNAKAL